MFLIAFLHFFPSITHFYIITGQILCYNIFITDYNYHRNSVTNNITKDSTSKQTIFIHQTNNIRHKMVEIIDEIKTFSNLIGEFLKILKNMVIDHNLK